MIKEMSQAISAATDERHQVLLSRLIWSGLEAVKRILAYMKILPNGRVNIDMS
jgi:hypothetical protein